MQPAYTLVSHPLCPYVQRAAIVLAEKALAFERRDIDLARKPDWFMRISPLGKTPVLLVAGGQAIFESAVICEYLEDCHGPALHPADALTRARHRGWMEFGSATLNGIAAFYNAPDAAALAQRAAELRGRLEQLEAALGAGPWFAGRQFGMVDAVFGPVFRYFELFGNLDEFDFCAALPRLQAWRAALARRASVRMAAPADYAERLRDFVLARGAALAARLQSRV